jgi:hypothetical protein
MTIELINVNADFLNKEIIAYLWFLKQQEIKMIFWDY